MPIFVCKLFWMPSRPELNHTVALFSSSHITTSQFITSDRKQRPVRDWCIRIHMRSLSFLCLFQWLYGKQIKLLWTWGCIQIYFYIEVFFFYGTCHQMRELANLGVNCEVKGCSQCFNSPWLKRETVCNLINKPENILIYTKSQQTC